MLIKHCLLFLIVFQFSDIIASVSPEELLIKVRSKTRLVKDFQAEADIKIDIDFLKAPVSHATIYYRSPGQVRIKSDGFSMLPKQGAGLPISSILETEYSAAARGHHPCAAADEPDIRAGSLPLGVSQNRRADAA